MLVPSLTSRVQRLRGPRSRRPRQVPKMALKTELQNRRGGGKRSSLLVHSSHVSSGSEDRAPAALDRYCKHCCHIQASLHGYSRQKPRPLTSVPDPNPDPNPPDPHVFGPPGSGSGSISQRYGSGSGSCFGFGSFSHQAKIVRKS